MEVISNINLYHSGEKVALALGNFDGVHRGHIAVIQKCVSAAFENKIKSAVYTFKENTKSILNSVELITSYEKRNEIIGKYGIDKLFEDDFDNVKELDCEEFVDFIINKLNAQIVICGYNFHFGKDARGNAGLLKKLCKSRNVQVFIIPCEKYDKMIASSSNIRKFIKKGDMDNANFLLSRPFSISGKVVKDKQNGLKLGVCTANIYSDSIIPKKGVYISKTKINNKSYKSITNIGIHPSIDANKEIVIETHILDFDNDIYNEIIEIEFLKRLRSEIKFKSKEELVNTIKHDIWVAKNYFEDKNL